MSENPRHEDTNGGMHRADFVTGLVLLAFSSAAVYFSVTMPRLEHRGINPLSAPGVVPGLLGVVIGIFSLILLVRAIANRGYRLWLTPRSLLGFVRSPQVRRIATTVAVCLLYAWGLVGRIHYTVATFLFVALFILVFDLAFSQDEKRTPGRIAAAAVVEAVLVAGIVSAVFQYLFLVSLP